MNFVKRKVTKAANKLPVNFGQLCSRFYLKIQALICEHIVPDDLIVNWDQTGVDLSSKYSMTAVGSKQVPVIGGDD